MWTRSLPLTRPSRAFGSAEFLSPLPKRFKSALADEIAHAAVTHGGISFGTNDLTQTALGISRDDSGSFLPGYAELEIVKKKSWRTATLRHD